MFSFARLALFGTAPVPAAMETKVSSEVKPKPGPVGKRWEMESVFQEGVVSIPLWGALLEIYRDMYGILCGSWFL